jgi:hypothetical protein
MLLYKIIQELSKLKNGEVQERATCKTGILHVTNYDKHPKIKIVTA